MKIGLPKEIKNNESRVGMTESGVHALVSAGHDVIVQTKAGINIGISDEEYQKALSAL